MRETDRLIRLIAEAIKDPDEALKEAERDARSEIERTARLHNTTPLLVARELWATFKERGGARKTINRWLKNGVIEPLSPAEFERRRLILDRYQKGARRVIRKRKGAGAEAVSGKACKSKE